MPADKSRIPSYTRGTVRCEFRVIEDSTLMSAESDTGYCRFFCRRGRIIVYLSDGNRCAEVELEDATPIDDGQWHTLTWTCGDYSAFYVDGGVEMTSTWKGLLAAVAGEDLHMASSPLAEVRHVSFIEEVLSPREVMGLCQLPEPVVVFASQELAEYDARRLHALRCGTIVLRFRTRGVGQQGVILEAGTGSRASLRLSVSAEAMRFETLVEGVWRQWCVPGYWAQGEWHDVAIRSGRGATDVFVDGQRSLHGAGFSFFADTEDIERVVIGQNLEGERLFGEVSEARIYSDLLTEGHIRHLAHQPGAVPVPVFDRGMCGAASYRIPSLVALPSGRLVAGADRRIETPNDAPNEIHFVVRTSDDGGETWSPMRDVWSYPGGGRDGASLIDAAMVYDARRGRLHVLVDHFPGGIGQFNSTRGTGMTSEGELLLFTDAGEPHVLGHDGVVRRQNGVETDYVVDEEGRILQQGEDAGRIYAKAGASALHMVPTSYLLHMYSDDEGETWSRPRHLNHCLKEEWMVFLGTGPGAGIQLTHAGPHAGRLLIPYYASGESGQFFSAGVIYSDDGGVNWSRGASVIEGEGKGEDRLRHGADKSLATYEATVIERGNGDVVILMRNQHPSGRVAMAVSEDGGASWGDTTYQHDLPEIFSQPHAIRVSGAGAECFAFANASLLLPFRGEGVLRCSTDGGATWPLRHTIKSGHYVYQCLADMGEGMIGILWENEWQGLYFERLRWPGATGVDQAPAWCVDETTESE